MTENGSCRHIFIKDLENNIVIGRDTLDSQGKILLAEGFIITEAFKTKRLLNQHNILLISIKADIKEETEEIQESGSSTYKKQVLKEAINEFNKNKENLEESINKFIKGEKIEIQEIENQINNTLKAFKNDVNIFQLMQSVKHLDDITYSHCHNVALISYSIGKWIELDEDKMQNLVLGGMLIDIGKIQIDDEILNKESKITDQELIELRKHSIYSHNIIKDYDFISDEVKKIVLFHHERIDGSGYPLGLKGENIPLLSRIVAIADVYNALISHRPYRDKRTPFEAIKVLETEYMGKLDANILYLFLNRIASNYIGQNIVLNNGEEGEIVFIPKHNMYRPLIKIQEDKIVDLASKDNSLEIVDFL